jgi:hypothetical protein
MHLASRIELMRPFKMGNMAYWNQGFSKIRLRSRRSVGIFGFSTQTAEQVSAMRLTTCTNLRKS